MSSQSQPTLALYIKEIPGLADIATPETLHLPQRLENETQENYRLRQWHSKNFTDNIVRPDKHQAQLIKKLEETDKEFRKRFRAAMQTHKASLEKAVRRDEVKAIGIRQYKRAHNLSYVHKFMTAHKGLGVPTE